MIAALLTLPVACGPFTYDAVALPKALLFSFATLLAVLLFAASGDLASRWPRLPLREMGLPLAAFLLLATAACLHGPAPIKGLVGDYQRYRGLLALFSYGTLALLAPALADNAAARRRLLLAIAGASLPVSLYALAQRFGLDPLPWDLSAGREALAYRAFATFGSPSFLGAYLALALPIGVAVWPGSSRFTSSLLAAVLGVGLPALLFTYSRGAWIGAAVGLAFAVVRLEGGACEKCVGPPRPRLR